MSFFAIGTLKGNIKLKAKNTGHRTQELWYKNYRNKMLNTFVIL